MATSWNYVWGESWREYLHRSTLTDDLIAAQRESSSEMIGAISDQTASILAGMGTSNRILAEGFSQLGDWMDMIGQEISGLNASFQWGFGQMIAQMGGMNASLQTLIQISRTPVQTWAYNQFEIARENFRKGLYSNCLTRLDKAINGDHTSAGYEEEWRFHQMVGVIRLGFFGCQLDLIDLTRAEGSFLLAARYARSDEPKEAAKAFLSAGWTAFTRGDLARALAHTEQAIGLDSALSEAFFQAAKIEMASGLPQPALRRLRSAIDQEPTYVLKAGADGDFKRHEDMLNSFFAGVRQEILSELVPAVNQISREATEWGRTIPEVAACSSTHSRWSDVLRRSWGLLDLLRYRKEGFLQDKKAVTDARELGLARQEADQRAKAAAASLELQKEAHAAVARLAEAVRLRERRKDNAGTGAGIGSSIGAVVMGFAGCASCLNYLPPPGSFPITPFNLFTGLLIGAAVGAIVGAAIGYVKE